MNLHKFTFREIKGRDAILNDMKKSVIPSFFPFSDDTIKENSRFEYQVITPGRKDTEVKKETRGKMDSLIILFHGLNERSWDKYYPWADYISNNTGKPVLLFPMAFHINRAPSEWSEPRIMQKYVMQESADNDKVRHLTFLNYALSKRVEADPYRFYLAGRESVNNVCQLVEDIRKDRHPLIGRNAQIDIFAYSIGALMAQVLLMSNPGNLFTSSKLFLFCGGSLFNMMNGDSRMIMDRNSFKAMLDYYTNYFIYFKDEKRLKGDMLEHAFICHIDRSLYRDQRESFYRESSPRVRIISLKKDRVIPTEGIIAAMGEEYKKCLQEMDFPFPYSHENPFGPLAQRKDIQEDVWFRSVFDRVSEFLG